MAAPSALYGKHDCSQVNFLKYVYTTMNAPFLDDYIR